MLASITPLGERGRQARWGLTVTAFILGSTLASATTGAVAGWLGGLVLGSGGERSRLGVLAVALVIGLILELGLTGSRLPAVHRQVDARWLDEYRGWVYGLGFGVQLGLGVVTIVTSAATYVTLLAALLGGGVLAGALSVGSFGVVRGASLLCVAHIRRPDQLVALHRRLARSRRTGRRGALAVLAAAALLAAIGAVAG